MFFQENPKEKTHVSLSNSNGFLERFSPGNYKPGPTEVVFRLRNRDAFITFGPSRGARSIPCFSTSQKAIPCQRVVMAAAGRASPQKPKNPPSPPNPQKGREGLGGTPTRKLAGFPRPKNGFAGVTSRKV